jgi:LysR family cyn operon transcriptional activator
MEIRHLRYFMAVADSAHFTRAAGSVHVSQPTLSQQIRQLEDELGTPLFDRVGRRVRLTAAGEILREHAQRVLRELDAARSAIGELEGLTRGTLAVGAVQTVHAYLVPTAIARFTAAHPSVGVRVRELSSGAVEQGLVEGALDLGIGFAPAAAPEVVSEPLFDEEVVLIAPEGHRLARRRQVRLRELDGEPLVLLSPEFCTRRLVDEGMREAGASPRVAVEMNSIESILETVRAGRAATLLPALALAGDAGPGLRAVAVAEPALRRTVGLLWLKDGYRCAAARAFAGEVRAAASGAARGRARPARRAR